MSRLQDYADEDHQRQPVCSRCGEPGEPYEYRGIVFDGLHANRGRRLCPPCSQLALETEPLIICETDPGRGEHFYDINENTMNPETEPPVRAIAGAYRYADYRRPARKGRRS